MASEHMLVMDRGIENLGEKECMGQGRCASDRWGGKISRRVQHRESYLRGDMMILLSPLITPPRKHIARLPRFRYERCDALMDL